MKNFKKVIATGLALGMALSAGQMCSAAELSDRYNKTVIESFDDAETVMGDDGIITYFNTNATAENVVVTEDPQGGNYLRITSGGKDVQVATKKGTFKHEVTVIDMKIRAEFAGNFPIVNLINNGAKMGSQTNGFVRFVNSGDELRAYNIETGTNTATSGGNKWKNVRIVLDSVNKTVTTTVNGSQAKVVANLATEWDNNNVQLMFQVALNSGLLVDDIVVSDGKYMSNVIMDYDFENSSTVNGAVGNNFFYGVQKSQNPSVIYDAEMEEGNSYLDIANAAGCVIYTTPFAVEAMKPVVFEFRLKTDLTTNGKVFLRQSSAVQPTMFEIKSGVVDGPSKDKEVADGNFHTYRITFIPKDGNGYTAPILVDNVWVGTLDSPSNTYAGTNLDLRFNTAAGSAMAIDDLKIYYPQEAKLFSDLDGKTDVPVSSAIEIVSNTQINASSATKATITANGETVAYTTSSDSYKNSYIYNIEGGLQYGTTYVITTGAKGVKDMFEQFYNETITFTTEAKPEIIIPVEGEITCKVDGEKVDTLVNGTMEVSFLVKSNTNEGATASGFLAEYDSFGRLVYAEVAPIEAEGFDQARQRVFYDVTKDTASIKLFVWNNGIEALCQDVELNR